MMSGKSLNVMRHIFNWLKKRPSKIIVKDHLLQSNGVVSKV